MEIIVDKFYSIIENLPDITEYLELNQGNQYLEPAVGSGNLLKLIPNEQVIIYDLYPDNNDIEPTDFLTVNLEYTNFITVMNPPYGKQCSLAIKFFNHAAKFSKKIICIVPLTFNKISIQNKLDLRFSLLNSIQLPKNSFTENGKPYDVPTCIQIWERVGNRKKIETKMTTELFEFSTFEDYDFAVRRAGSKTGQIVKVTKNVQGIYFIKGCSFIERVIGEIDFSDIINQTVGPKSLSKHEFIERVENYVRNYYTN